MSVRVAIVGCGAVAEIGHIPAARRLEKVSLVALVDADKARAEELAARFEVPQVASSVTEVAKGVDAVILATPPHVRPVLAEQAFGAGLHVLCEKPLANNSAECRIILAAAKQAKRVLAVAHNYRFFPNRIQVDSLLQQKFLGMLFTVDVEEGYPWDWPTRTGYSVRRDLVPGGVLINNGLHSLDTLFWWFGTPLDFEYEDDALGGLESNVRIKMDFMGGISCKFRLSRTCTLGNRIVIEGETGKLSVPLFDQAQISVTRNGETATRKVASCNWDFVGVLAEQLQDFVLSIETMGMPRVTGAEGLRVIEFIEKCYAAKHQRPLPKRAPIPGLTW
ncbi:MAG: Gfo/Idh/MocA family protein [Candidatus Methylomirabilales bacterium]